MIKNMLHIAIITTAITGSVSLAEIKKEDSLTALQAVTTAGQILEGNCEDNNVETLCTLMKYSVGMEFTKFCNEGEEISSTRDCNTASYNEFKDWLIVKYKIK